MDTPTSVEPFLYARVNPSFDSSSADPCIQNWKGGSNQEPRLRDERVRSGRYHNATRTIAAVRLGEDRVAIWSSLSPSHPRKCPHFASNKLPKRFRIFFVYQNRPMSPVHVAVGRNKEGRGGGEHHHVVKRLAELCACWSKLRLN